MLQDDQLLFLINDYVFSQAEDTQDNVTSDPPNEQSSSQDIEAMRAMIQALTKEEGGASDGYYFESYSSLAIHEVMLRDEPRTRGYRDAIAALDLSGRVVMDVGCGTGVLSLFAARSGASRVVGIERGAIARVAGRIVQLNRMENVVSVLQGRVEDLQLPDLEGQVDVLVSEWMGYGLYFENMLPSVLAARDRFLKPEGVLVPRTCSLCLQALTFSTEEDRVLFWRNVYGLDMSPLTGLLVEEAQVQLCQQSEVCSSRETVHTFDIKSLDEDELDFADDFSVVRLPLNSLKIE